MTRGRRGAAWYDTQYNSRARIPEHPAILQSWAERSAAARARMQGRLDQPYGLGDREAMDLFLPERPGAQAAPVLVWIHGGYWRALDKQAQSFVAEPYVAAGALVAVPGYALCPGVTVEHIVRQLVRALAWLHARLPRYGADPRRLVVAGHSAGAQLAAMLLLCRWREVDTRVRPRTLHHRTQSQPPAPARARKRARPRSGDRSRRPPWAWSEMVRPASLLVRPPRPGRLTLHHRAVFWPASA
jgi:carboxylesterase type B